MAGEEEPLDERIRLHAHRRTRYKPRAGDIFAMLPDDGQYLFGRVVLDDAHSGFGPAPALLLYVYRARAWSAEEVPALLRGDLLIPPVMTNRLGWVRGYFVHVRNEALAAADRFPRHCFDDTWGHYYDEYGGPVPEPFAPLALWGLASYALIDLLVHKALRRIAAGGSEGSR